MRKQTLLLILLALTGVATLGMPQQAAAQNAGQVHTVQRGETLFSISKIYDVAVSDIRKWNNLDSDNLSVGQDILVGPPRGENSTVHIVEGGETLFAISRQYGVTIAELQAWNNLEGTQLSDGQELTIFTPDSSEQDDSSRPAGSDDVTQNNNEEPETRESIVSDRGERGTTYYTVRSGDNLINIARQHNMTVDQLRDLNDLQSDMIRVGQQLTVRDVQTAPSIAESAEESTPQGKFVNYRVQSGENTGDLLEKFKMSRTELEALNPDLDINRVTAGQRITVLLPPSRNFDNPYQKGASLENLGELPATTYESGKKGEPTTSGELYNPDYLTAGHANMPLGNVVFIENAATGKGIYVRINDRISDNGIKLSRKAFDMLEFSSINQAEVVVYLDQ